MDAAGRLVEAARAGDVGSVRRALRHGADPDSEEPGTPRGTPVLVIAAQNGRTEIVRLLLEAGASPNAVSGFEWTPLRAATSEGHVDAVTLLLERGADPNSGRDRGSIVHEAVSSASHRPGPSSLAILDTLLRAGATTLPNEEPLIVGAVAYRAAPAVLRLLLAHGESANQSRRDGTPVLVLAARRGDPAAVDTLLQGGADVDAVDALGRTALMHAIERGLDAVVSTLLTPGADSTVRAPDGATAILLAQAWLRTRLQFQLGMKSVRPLRVDDSLRTVMDLKPTTYDLRSDQELFDRWAEVIEHTISDLGEDEFETLVGPVEVAQRFIERLRTEPATSDRGTWHSMAADDAEVAVMRGCLLNLAYGPRMEMPPGISATDVADMFEELAYQLRY